ncbi:MAG TPA: hypothetical protein VHQ65_02575 [Thermoanaerobaculia bacterium]|nr:hypothetical protein [Thermoanaerobaculia bacterium]
MKTIPTTRRPLACTVRAALALALLLALASAPPAAAADFVCDESTSMAVLGLDTASGTMLLRASGGPTGGAGWLIAATPLAATEASGAAAGLEWTESAEYFPEPATAAYGGSLGPGPVFALARCGDGCLQAVRWEAGAWRPLGDPLAVPSTATVHTTYDGGGRPWVVLQRAQRARGAAGQGGPPRVEATALRLEGRDWLAAGSMDVVASGAAEAVPATGRDDAIVSGTGIFAAGEAPRAWVSSLPKLPPERRGVVVPVDGGGAAYVTGDGGLFLSGDGGASWASTRWTPWGRTPTRIWTPGRDFTVDLPTGDRRGPLHLVWFDRRKSGDERILLTEWSPRRDWRLLSGVAAKISTLNEVSLDYQEVLVLRPGVWVLLSGCINTVNGPGLVLRTYGPAGLSAPRFLPLRPGRAAAVPESPLDPLAPLPR